MSGDSPRIYRVDQLPILQNRPYETRGEALRCPVGDVVPGWDPVTGILTNLGFRSGLVVYDRHYNNEQGFSEAYRRHPVAVAGLIRGKIDGKTLLEVGCGKGRFLDFLRNQGYEVRGIDPTYEGNDPMVEKRLFEAGSGLRTDGIVLRHVLEHIENPVEFLRRIKEANGGRGRIYIEVPCFDWIARSRTWFDIFYEHVNYFRASDFERIFGGEVSVERSFGGSIFRFLPISTS